MGRLQAVLSRVSETLPGRVVLKFGEDRGSLIAIVLAWNLLLSIFPIALVTAGVLGLALRGTNPSDVYYFVVQIFPNDPTTRNAALDALKGVQQQSGVFLVIGLAGLVWSGTLLFGAMDESFAFIYHVPPRGFLQQRLLSLVMMSVYTVLTGLAIGVSALVTVLKDVPGLPALASNGSVGVALGAAVVAASGVVLFSLIYLIVPNLRLAIGEVLPGAALAGLAFAALSVLFPTFVGLNSGLNRYGQSFALLFILMAFFYFVGAIIVFGVELNSVLRGTPVKRTFAFAPAGGESPETRQAPVSDARPAPWTGVGAEPDATSLGPAGDPRLSAP